MTQEEVLKILLKTLVSALILISTLKLFAQNCETTQFEVEGTETLTIKGYRGKVILSGSSKAVNSKVRKKAQGPSQIEVKVRRKGNQEGWGCTIEKLDQEIKVEVRGPSTKEEWKEGAWISSWPEFEFVVTGGNLPTVVSWYDGELAIEGWHGKVEAAGQRLRGSVRENKGDFKILAHEGSIKVEKHEGALFISGFSPMVVLKSIEGSIRIENFSGPTQVEGTRGKVYLKSQKGKSTLKGIEGTLRVFNGEGPVVIRDLKGAIEGESRQGSMDIELKKLSQVRLRTAEGAVVIRPPKDSGAKVSLGSHEGPLFVPRFLKVSNYANMKVAAGRLTGDKPGTIHVRTLKGKIQLR